MTDHAQRPWGAYTVLAEAGDHKVKTIEVNPGQRLSYQRHARRSEHWFVVSGAGVVTLDGELTEVQHGDYFGEDDIVRLDDDYGRSEPERLPTS